MLPPNQRIAFVLFALACMALAGRGFARMMHRIRRGRRAADTRLDRMAARVLAALWLTLTQQRTFRRRPWVSFFHAFIFYGFVVYLTVNAVDALEGFTAMRIASTTAPGATYNLTADILSALVLVGVLALVARRFLLPSRKDFRFNKRTLLHERIRSGFVRRDSVFVSTFILFHVGSRALGAGAKLSAIGGDRWQPFASLIARGLPQQHAHAWELFGYWGALGSVLAFLAYFPYSKHIHLMMTPVKYAVARRERSGVLPAMEVNATNAEAALQLGAERLEDLSWPRLLDAYACIQCNRCQDVCPATATGKALSPSALEINKRMELNALASALPSFEQGAASPRPLLGFALSPEAAWACTTCGACIDVCPVGDEPMLDIVEVRRHQVMMAGEFPATLQSAFRGMERASNPWGLPREQRMDWAKGLNVATLEENPDAALLYWVGCAPSYDPQAQKTARAFAQLLTAAGVDFAVLGKRESCTGDSARRAGNEYLYRQLAEENVRTLDAVKPKRIVTTCPHCLNSLGQEYRQLGGEYEVVHHTELLASLIEEGRLQPRVGSDAIAFHDPCYLGRHNGVYDAPRSVLRVLSNDVRELPRARENSFCCGAGGAQFWKEEEPGEESIASNRLREGDAALAGERGATLAVGCPFCKSMLGSAKSEDAEAVAIRDVAELVWDAVRMPQEAFEQTVLMAAAPIAVEAKPIVREAGLASQAVWVEPAVPLERAPQAAVPVVDVPPAARAKWKPKAAPAPAEAEEASFSHESSTAVEAKPVEPTRAQTARKKWTPSKKGD